MFMHIRVDVTDETAVKTAVQQVLDAEGKIDILVNCAGFGISGAVEFTALEDAKRQFDVNFFGMVNCSKAVLKPMRKAGSGGLSISVRWPVLCRFRFRHFILHQSGNQFLHLRSSK